MLKSVNTGTTEEIMPDASTPGDQLEAKLEVTAQSSGSETDHSTTHSRNEGIVCNSLSFISILHVLVSPNDILYTGRMYHVEKKVVGHWKTIYSVVRDLEVLKQVELYVKL